MPNDAPQTLVRSDGSTIAYHRLSGKSPGVVFLTGFKSDMTGSKAMAAEAVCRARGQAFVRFDYTGHGASSGPTSVLSALVISERRGNPGF